MRRGKTGRPTLITGCRPPPPNHEATDDGLDTNKNPIEERQPPQSTAAGNRE